MTQRWVLIARCDERRAAAEAEALTRQEGSLHLALIAATLHWKRLRALLERQGPLPWEDLAEAAAATYRGIAAARRLQPESATAGALAERLARTVRTYKLFLRAPELEPLVRTDTAAVDADTHASEGGAWILFSPAAMDRAPVDEPGSTAGDARTQLVAALAYFRRCLAVVGEPQWTAAELLPEASRALRCARAAAGAPGRTLGSLRTLHRILTFCQQYGLADAAPGESLPALLDALVSDLHSDAAAQPALPWASVADLRTLVVRHHLYETGDLAGGVSLAEQYAARLRSLPDAPCPDAEPRRLLFAEDWVGFLGHLCLFDYYIKAKLLGAMRWEELIVAALPHMRVANAALLDRWRPWLTVVKDREDLDRLGPGAQREIVGTTMRVDGREWYWAAACADIQKRWEQQGRAPLLQLTDADHERARPLLARLGLPRDGMHVCVHAREAGYHKESGVNSQAHRNADIMAFVPSMRLLVSRGFTVLRMGDPTMRPLPAIDGVIDYCHHPARDPWLDVYLMASAQFFVGCTSGLVMVAHLFGTPTALSHFVPPCARPYTNQDLFLPRLHWSDRDARVLSFPEVLTPPLATTFYYDRLRSQGIRALDPSEDEITALTEEMWERWRGTATYTADDEERQARYDALNSRVPWFGSNGRVGRDFLRSHADLLEQYSNELSG